MPHLQVCTGINCGPRSKYICERLEQMKGKGVAVTYEKVGCMDQCTKSCNVKINGVIYSHQNPVKVAELVKRR